MNRKIVAMSFVLMILAILAVPIASAKPTSAENNPNSISFMWHSENGGSANQEVTTNPPWAGPEDTIVSHIQETWTLNPFFENYVQIGDDKYPIDPDTGYEGALYVQMVGSFATAAALNYRVYERILWDDNYIEIMCLERATAGADGFYASGTFSGHGIIDGQKVQVTGIREGFVDPSIGFVLECYGTIRMAGNV